PHCLLSRSRLFSPPISLSVLLFSFFFVFFSNAPATSVIYTLSLHDALPISLPLRITYDLFPYVSRNRFFGNFSTSTPREMASFTSKRFDRLNFLPTIFLTLITE